MEKILTIVIPTYNMQDYLRRCLDSLIVPEEQMKQMEVLVINDGSKDNSSAIAHEYQDKYPDMFRVIDKENGNYGSCVNRGLKEATGKYIKILDADDWFDKEAFSVYLHHLSLQNVDVVMNDCQKVNSSGKKCGSYKMFGLEDCNEFSFTILYEKKIFPQMHCIAYRTELLKAMNYHQTEGISYTDQEWVSKPMSNVSSLVYFMLPVYNYMVGRVGQTMDRNMLNRKFSDHASVIFSIMDYISSCNIPGNNNIAYLHCKMCDLLYYIYYIHIIDGIFEDKEFCSFDSVFQNKYAEFYSLFIKNKLLTRLWSKRERCVLLKLGLQIISFLKHKK